MNLCTNFSRTLIRNALQCSNATVEAIESDLVLCACTKEYLRQVGQKIDRIIFIFPILILFQCLYPTDDFNRVIDAYPNFANKNNAKKDCDDFKYRSTKV